MPADDAVATDTPLEWEGLPLLQHLGTDARRRLVALAGAGRAVQAGEVLTRQDAPAVTMYLLARGTVVSRSTTVGGRELVLDEWHAPALVDKVPVFAGSTHPGSLVMVSAGHVHPLPVDDFLEVLRTDAQAWAHVSRVLAAAGVAARRSFAATAEPVPERVVDWLEGHAVAGMVDLPGGQDQLAQRLGTTRVSVARAFATLRAAGELSGSGARLRWHPNAGRPGHRGLEPGAAQ